MNETYYVIVDAPTFLVFEGPFENEDAATDHISNKPSFEDDFNYIVVKTAGTFPVDTVVEYMGVEDGHGQ